MPLNDEQLTQYRNDGFISLPSLFQQSEIDALVSEQDRIFSLDLDSHLIAESGEFLGTTAMDRVSHLYQRLLADERLLGIAEQLLGPELYCHQYKIIIKKPFGTLTLPWHQDYAPWKHHDGMPNPTAISVGVFLDEVTEFNGPITYIPGSHQNGLIDFEMVDVPGSTPLPGLPDKTVAELIGEHGLVAPKGKPGSVTIFDSCTAHASAQNLSSYPRNLIYLSYNPVSNAIQKPTRPSHFAMLDFTPLHKAPKSNLLA